MITIRLEKIYELRKKKIKEEFKKYISEKNVKLLAELYYESKDYVCIFNLLDNKEIEFLLLNDIISWGEMIDLIKSGTISLDKLILIIDLRKKLKETKSLDLYNICENIDSILIEVIEEITLPKYFYRNILGISDTIDRIFYTMQSKSLDLDTVEELFEEGLPVNWECISSQYKLTEEFIEKYKEYLDWEEISKFQDFSEKFLEKYYERLNLGVIEERIKKQMS